MGLKKIPPKVAEEPITQTDLVKIGEIGPPQVGEVIPGSFTSEYSFPKPEAKLAARSRHIFIFLDGTWNEERTPLGKATPTNVLRMFQQLGTTPDPPANSEIIAHYYRGVGNRQDNVAMDRMWFGFTGKEEERIRRAAFADVYRDYRSDKDRIYILGFSRGAASARLLARNICEEGFPSRLKVSTKYFANLLTGQIEARVFAVEQTGNADRKPRVAFLGCWDTVDAFVLPSRFPREGTMEKIIDKTIRATKSALFPRVTGKERFSEGELKIPDGVEKAVHCVAIDETRNAFLPTLMPYQPNIEEVWFPGVHSDVGGGYDDNMLAHAPYEFMKERLSRAFDENSGGLFRKVPSDIAALRSDSSEYCFHFHGLNSGLKRMRGLGGFGTAIRRIRVLDQPEGVRPKIHESLYRIMGRDSVFGADRRNKRTWTITYDPYNVRELKEQFEIVS